MLQNYKKLSNQDWKSLFFHHRLKKKLLDFLVLSVNLFTSLAIKRKQIKEIC